MGWRLAFENKLNFQREYARLIGANVKHEVAVVTAVKNISYGKHRIAAGFTKLTVSTSPCGRWISVKVLGSKEFLQSSM